MHMHILGVRKDSMNRSIRITKIRLVWLEPYDAGKFTHNYTHICTKCMRGLGKKR